MYLISKDEDLNQIRLGKILADFQTRELPKLKQNWNYYIGKQPIINKKYSDDTKPCNRVVINYCHSIVQNYLGYLTGLPIQYSNDKEFEQINDVLNYNDCTDEDTELLRQALIYGRSFEINYIDEEGKQRFKVLDTQQCVPVYWNNLNNDLAYVVRFYEEDLINEQNQNYIVEVYGNTSTAYFKSTPGFTSFALLDEQPNYFNQVPITVFSLNKDETSIFEQIKTLNDSYNSLYSGAIDDFDQFADAYLIIKGAIATEQDIDSMKKNRVLMLDADSDASYLTKTITDTALQDILKTANDHIHTISNSPDFNDEKFMAQSGIAIKYKLVGFENVAASIENAMKKALQRRIELICSIINLTGGEEMWRDIQITFTRNLPISLDPSTPQELMTYRGLVSDESLLSQIPFVDDVDSELNKMKKQEEENIKLYNGFGEISRESDEQ